MRASRPNKPAGTRYWSLADRRPIISQLRGHLDAVLEFAKVELGAADAMQKVQDFSKRLTGSSSITPLTWTSAELRDAQQVQAHLRRRLAQVAGETTFGLEEALWKVTVEFRMAPIEDRFIADLSVADSRRKSEVSRLQAVIDLRLIELVRGLDLTPQGFMHCARCGAVFYQPTRRAKNFCSPRCAGAERQARFRKEDKTGSLL